jgi:CHASE2 domain-containing sensor protein
MKLLRHLKPGWRGALFGLCCGLAAWGMTRLPFFLLLEERFQDGCFSFRGNRSSATRVVLVSLDSGSLEALRKPALFSSPELAEVVAYLKGQGAAAIGLDLIVPQSYADLPELQAGAVGDATQLGQAILEAGNVVLPELQVQDRWLSTLPQWRLKSFLAPDPSESVLPIGPRTEIIFCDDSSS